MLDRLFLGSSAVDTDPNFDYVTLLLPGNGSNGAQNNTFLDASTNNFTITRNGDTTQGSFSPYGDLWSNYFDGSGDYLTAPSNTALVMGTGQFWFEAWIYMPAAPSSQYIVLGSNEGTLTSSALTVRIQPSALRVDRHGIVAYDSSTVTWQYNAWQHIAVGRDAGNTLRFFVNGQAVGTRASTTDNFAGNSSAIGLIPIDNAPTTAFRGYISDARLLKGQCLYTSSFTPPAAPLTAITNTSLLLNFTNAGIVDASAKNDLVTVGNAQISTAQSKFGGGSMYLTGSNDVIRVPSSINSNFGSGNFTIEFWIYPTVDAVGVQRYFHDEQTNYALVIRQDYVSSKRLQAYFKFGTTTIVFVNSSTAPTYNAWQHIALVRNGSSFTLYKNGVSIASTTNTGSLNYDFAFNIGANTFEAFTGYIDDLRITKGVARYTADFTPPAAPFPVQ